MVIDRVEIKKAWLEQLEKDLTKQRFEHSIRVAEVAYYLAIVHKMNVKKAVKAALLHDCTKCFSLNEQLKICKKAGYEPTKYERVNGGLLHSKSGAIYAREVYGIKSKKILNAIAYHTTGKADMTKLEKIVFISDFIELGRKFDFDIDYIVKAAFKDLDLAVYYIADSTINYLKNKSKVFDPKTMETYNYYRELCKDKLD